MKAAPAAVVAAGLVVADAALACPSCVDPNAQNTQAMLVSTIFMSVVPLAFLISLAVWVYRRDKKNAEDAGVDIAPGE